MRSNDFFNWLREMAKQEGAVIIAPYPEPFTSYQRQFLDGLRRCPAAITGPRGKDPFALALDQSGRWMMIWIPNEK